MMRCEIDYLRDCDLLQLTPETPDDCAFLLRLSRDYKYRAARFDGHGLVREVCVEIKRAEEPAQ